MNMRKQSAGQAIRLSALNALGKRPSMPLARACAHAHAPVLHQACARCEAEVRKVWQRCAVGRHHPHVPNDGDACHSGTPLRRRPSLYLVPRLLLLRLALLLRRHRANLDLVKL
eukprot:353375-Chlamydomonas_euryale.AAC.9